MSVDKQRRAFFMTGQVKKINNDIHLPYLKSSEEFLDKCTQCNECVSACPENVIIRGQGGFPTVDFSESECTFCQDCASACPESLFDINQATPWQLELKIDDTCLTQKGIVCQSCQDACEPAAIRFKYELKSVPKPTVDITACTTCGACVSSCPVNSISLTQSNSVNIAFQEVII